MRKRLARSIRALSILLLSGCCRNPYYCSAKIPTAYRMSAVAVITGPIPCDADNCGKSPSNLALPSLWFDSIDPSQKADLMKLRAFIRTYIPKAEITITPVTQPMQGWERFPLLWNGMQIWIRRPPIRDDRKILYEA